MLNNVQNDSSLDGEKWVKNPIIDQGESFRDERGIIQSIISFSEAKIGSVMLIESKNGSVRANHYHKVDWHYCYVISGSIEYYCRLVGSENKPNIFQIHTNQIFYTPPLVEHAMVFNEDASFFVFSGGTRLQNDYENDLVRVKLL